MANKQDTNKVSPDLTPSLVGKVRAGDAQAGVLLDQLYRQVMIQFCWGHLGSVEEAEDAVQEVFCKVLKATEVPDNFRAWLYKIARNHCLNVRRGYARRRDRHNGWDSGGRIRRHASRLHQDWVAGRHAALPLRGGRRDSEGTYRGPNG